MWEQVGTGEVVHGDTNTVASSMKHVTLYSYRKLVVNRSMVLTNSNPIIDYLVGNIYTMLN